MDRTEYAYVLAGLMCRNESQERWDNLSAGEQTKLTTAAQEALAHAQRENIQFRVDILTSTNAVDDVRASLAKHWETGALGVNPEINVFASAVARQICVFERIGNTLSTGGVVFLNRWSVSPLAMSRVIGALVCDALGYRK